MSDPDTQKHLDPQNLGADAVDAHTYHATVGPALGAAAEVAAKRGHPTLHDDMPAMLALVEMVTRLVEIHAEDRSARQTPSARPDNAATGACVMVLQQAEMAPAAIGQCLAALETAHRQLHAHDVLAKAQPLIATAAAHLADGQRDAARRCLEQATQASIAAIEAWQAQIH